MKDQKLSLIILFLLLSCVSVNAQTTSQTPEKSTPANAPELKKFKGKRYRLNPGDVLEVIYRYTPEFNQTATVHPDGFIVLEIVGELEVEGLTLEQTRQKLLAQATKRLKDPEITLLLKQFQKPYYIVSGEVLQPGKFEMNENITALQAVMMAGGFKESAKVSQVFVFRKINKELAEVKMIDLKKIRKTSDLEKDLDLESGDILFVPQNNFSKFEKYIKLTSIGSLLNPLIR
jgi:polysaccharide export outer membrane protein